MSSVLAEGRGPNPADMVSPRQEGALVDADRLAAATDDGGVSSAGHSVGHGAMIDTATGWMPYHPPDVLRYAGRVRRPPASAR